MNFGRHSADNFHVSILSQTATGTRKLHDEVLASLPSAPRFDWHDAEAGVVFSDSLLIVYDRFPDSIVRVPVEAIRDVTLRRGCWSTLACLHRPRSRLRFQHSEQHLTGGHPSANSMLA